MLLKESESPLTEDKGWLEKLGLSFIQRFPNKMLCHGDLTQARAENHSANAGASLL